jgi:formamidopyrimidine-DNA glycosylase
LGPDPLRDDWDFDEALHRLTADPDRTVAAALLDQRCVAGFGNWWTVELCFLRGISPWTRIGDTDAEALLRLGVKALRHSAFSPGAHQVTTGDTRPGNNAYVAQREHQPCRRCGTPIRQVAETPGDPERRRTWWCPTCQPGPGPA